jgi:phenylacetate-CoA ligase
VSIACRPGAGGASVDARCADRLPAALDRDCARPEADRAAKADEVRHHIKSLIGVTCGVGIMAPGEVPRSQGKAVRVKDLRKPAD